MSDEVVLESQPNWLGLTGSRVLVAGAGGIGSACAKAFVDAGAKVALVDLDPERLEVVSKELGPDALTITADLSTGSGAREAVARVEAAFDGIDVLVHAVGINLRKPVLDFTDDEWTRIQKINLDSAFYLAQAAGKSMIERRFGRIILLSSVSGLLAHPDHAPYAASKGAINQMMRVMAREWAPCGVTVNAIAPGYIETDLTQDYLSKGDNRAKLEKMVPAGRLGTTWELTGPALFLVSRHASFITGHVLYVDGGRTLV